MIPGPQNFDPNLLEYMGTTSGLPSFLWQPNDFKGRKDFNKCLGIHDDGSSELTYDINFMVWSQYVFKPESLLSGKLNTNGMESSPELV